MRLVRDVSLIYRGLSFCLFVVSFLMEVFACCIRSHDTLDFHFFICITVIARRDLIALACTRMFFARIWFLLSFFGRWLSSLKRVYPLAVVFLGFFTGDTNEGNSDVEFEKFETIFYLFLGMQLF